MFVTFITVAANVLLYIFPNDLRFKKTNSSEKMIPREASESCTTNQQSSLLRKSSTILSLTSEALCIAVSTALRLVDQRTEADTGGEPEETLAKAVSSAVTTALLLVDQKTDMTEDKRPQENLNKVSSVMLLENKIETLPKISLDQVSWHDTSTDCWVVIYDRVYDITEFLYEHPGGEDVLLEYAGRDATLAFRGVGHSGHAWRALDKYLVGVLPDNECIFKKGGERAVEAPSFAASLAASC